MQSDGFDSWKSGVEKEMSSRPKRKAAKENPFAPQPGHQPTKRQLSLGAKPKEVVNVNYIPPKDKGGNKIWDGQRGSMSFSPKVAGTMPPRVGCFHKKSGCTGGADAIDHQNPFSERQAGLPRYIICDGRNHFEACLKDEAQEMYDAAPLVWSCTSCNSSKGGKKGLYENRPTFIEACPGEDDCEIPAGGKPV